MIQPLISYALTAAALTATLALFLSLKCEMRAQERKQRREMESMAAQVLALAVKRHAEPIVPIAVAPPPRSGFNLNVRVQVLRLLRRGEDVSHIAAALAVPRSEVELFIRVHEITGRRADVSPT